MEDIVSKMMVNYKILKHLKTFYMKIVNFYLNINIYISILFSKKKCVWNVPISYAYNLNWSLYHNLYLSLCFIYG